jgi:hypothetical protein
MEKWNGPVKITISFITIPSSSSVATLDTTKQELNTELANLMGLGMDPKRSAQ